MVYYKVYKSISEPLCFVHGIENIHLLLRLYLSLTCRCAQAAGQRVYAGHSFSTICLNRVPHSSSRPMEVVLF